MSVSVLPLSRPLLLLSSSCLLMTLSISRSSSSCFLRRNLLRTLGRKIEVLLVLYGLSVDHEEVGQTDTEELCYNLAETALTTHAHTHTHTHRWGQDFAYTGSLRCCHQSWWAFSTVCKALTPTVRGVRTRSPEGSLWLPHVISKVVLPTHATGGIKCTILKSLTRVTNNSQSNGYVQAFLMGANKSKSIEINICVSSVGRGF